MDPKEHYPYYLWAYALMRSGQPLSRNEAAAIGPGFTVPGDWAAAALAAHDVYGNKPPRPIEEVAADIARLLGPPKSA